MKILRHVFLLSSTLLYIQLRGQAQETLSYTDIEREYLSGIELFEKKSYVAARKHFERYTELAKKQVAPNTYSIANATYYATLAGLYTNSLDAPIEVERFVTNFSGHPKAKLIYSDLGQKYFAEKDYERAIEYFTKAVQNRVASPQVAQDRFKLGVSYYQLGKLNEALPEFNYVKNSLVEEAIQAAYYAAVINFSKSNYDEALADLKRVENVNPYKIEVPNWIAQIYFKQKKYDELIAYATPIIASPNGRKIDDVALVTAEAYFFKDRYEEAAIYYDKFRQFRRSAIDPQVVFRHGFSLYKSNDFQKAANVLKPIATQRSALGQQAAYYVAISSLNAKDLNAAAAAFRVAQSLPYDEAIREEATYNYTKVLVEQGNNSEAIKQLTAYVQGYPNGKYVDQSNELLSDILFENNNYRAAIDYIESLKRRTPKINEAYQRLTFNEAILQFNSERYDDAIAYFNKSISSPTNAELVQQAQFWKAESSYALGREETEGLYRQLLNSNNPEIRLKSLYSMGYLFYNKKEYAKATTYFDEFVSKAKGQANLVASYEDALIRLADTYLVQKNYAKALNLYDQAIQSNRVERDYAMFQKATTLRFMERNDEANRLFKQLASSYPNSRLIDDAMFEQGSLEIENGNYQAAVTTFTELLRKRPNTQLAPRVLVKRALAYSNINQLERAIEDYKIIVRRFGKSEEAEEALIGLKEMYSRVGREDEFLTVLDEYRRNNPEKSSVVSLEFDAAKNLYFSQKYEQAIAAFKRFVASNPQNPNSFEATFFIADSYLSLKDNSNALRYFEQVVKENQTPYVATSAYRAASIYATNNDFQKAVANYHITAEASSNKREIVAAWEGLYTTYFAMGNFAQSIKYATEAMNNSGNVVMGSVNKANLYLGKNYQAQSMFSNAIAQYEKTMALAVDENAAEASYRIGEIAYLQGKYDESIKLLQQLGDKYSNFLTWYEQAFLLIAKNYIAKKDDFMAKATLNSIIENSETPSTVQAAKDLLKTIN